MLCKLYLWQASLGHTKLHSRQWISETCFESWLYGAICLTSECSKQTSLRLQSVTLLKHQRMYYTQEVTFGHYLLGVKLSIVNNGLQHEPWSNKVIARQCQTEGN